MAAQRATRDVFWRWVASWGAMVRSPADLGHDASAYAPPPLNVHQHTVEIPDLAHGLFAQEAQTLMDRRDARRKSLVERVRACADLVNANDEPWVVWCDLNAEGDALTAAIRGAVQIAGADDADVKERRLTDFAHGRIRVLVSNLRSAGSGSTGSIARMAFVGVTDSFRAYYQAVRRCWRFGQRRPVDVHVFASNQEGAVVANLRRKEQDARPWRKRWPRNHRRCARRSAGAQQKPIPTNRRPLCACRPGWRPHELHRPIRWRKLRDLSRRLRGRHQGPARCQRALLHFSPPFASLYTYSNSPRDMGNWQDE